MQFLLHDFANYSSSLSHLARDRYLEKLKLARCDCPYSIEGEFWLTSDIELRQILPNVTNLDLVNYLLFSRSVYTQEELKNYKSCNSWKILSAEGKFILL